MVLARLSKALGRRLQTVTLLSPSSRLQQRRWAQVHDVRFLATTQAPRNIAEKYREKLDRKAQAEGLRNVDELKTAYADRIQELKKRDSISVPGLDALLADEEPQAQGKTESKSQTQTQTETTRPPTTAPRSNTSHGSTKPLSEILDLDKARKLPVKELSAIWRLRHASSANSLCAVIPTATYRALERTARSHPSFVLPIPRGDQGAEIHFLQWVFDAASGTSTVLFTQLAEFKARGEWAQPHTSVTHYADYGNSVEGLSHEENQGVVLMAGSLVEGRGASIQDANWLVSLLQRFYGEEGTGGDSAKRKLVEEFGKGAGGEFSVEKLIEECEKLF
ncbi:ATP11 protein-domain-containing protein [Xylaria bambusicola]|uniref:ATP11 protein-domain-containing protein n=1 Tax=Xylaria bambusicola TaxID=326684 RepID=UPI002008A1ED|nr:ATP11 protein-domain-containing protein [Xylaria bambusicola]KAI0505535.1 ATP11 protein-domain-containing protein [Xylaria bambusicola]